MLNAIAALNLVQLGFGATPEALRVLSVVTDSIAATALFCLARRLGAPIGALFAAALYPLMSSWFATNDLKTLLEILAFLAIAGERINARAAALAGLAIGAAMMVKQTSLLEAIGLVAVLAFAQGAKRNRLLAFSAGALVAPLTLVGYYVAINALPSLLEDVVVAALKRPDVGYTDAAGIARHILALASIMTLLLIAAAVGALYPWLQPNGTCQRQ